MHEFFSVNLFYTSFKLNFYPLFFYYHCYPLILDLILAYLTSFLGEYTKKHQTLQNVINVVKTFTQNDKNVFYRISPHSTFQ